MTTEAHVELDALRERYGMVAFLSLAEAARYVHADPRTLLRDKTFPVKSSGKPWGHSRVPVVGLALWIARS